MSQELEQFKSYAALTYATKEEVQQLALSVESLKGVTETLNMKIDRNYDELKEEIENEISDLSDDLKDRIERVEDSVDGIKVELAGHIGNIKRNAGMYIIISESTKVKTLA